MRKIANIYNTVKYLKPIQILNRISRRFSKVKLNVASTECNNFSKSWQQVPLLPSCYRDSGQFSFLNVVDTLTDWNDQTKAKLWLYNLHYFDDLNQQGWQDRTEIHKDLIDSWIEQNPLMVGNGWEPYPISLRSVNWIKWFLSGNKPKDEWLNSLSLQVQALEQQLEYHLLGNHLFANAKALVFSGCFFKGDLACRWLERGLDILHKEVEEQILSDGGNFELSPMYHNIILADMLDLYQLSLVYPELIPERVKTYWGGTVQKMFEWAEIMQHPDGEVSFFNDSAKGVAPNLNALQLYSKELNLLTRFASDRKVFHLESSGYVVVQDQANKLIIDVAKVGPDYIPGHAHADTFSFELSIDGHRVFVNSGTSVYGMGEERLRQRKTETHNTVVVDGMDSSEVWSGFRVARRAYPSKPVITESKCDISVECSHDGYMRLPGKVTHTRNWRLTQGDLFINDSLTGRYNHAEAHYHVHPDIQIIESSSDDTVTLALPTGILYRVSVEGAHISVVDTTWHPEFGLSIANKKLVLNFRHKEVKFSLTRA
ncbi:heparinase II/III family protein [Vibrio vulnificus]|uniref:heparinase II/III family protein n=1 Tax=Vibrio vulnificus TaxID=672 RepID=UPI00159349A9|nr:heparinase II/III family protein [Vibrio vulnificus]EJE8558590.1 alginate lyase family protein [Vibrio vulnificus]NVD20944.1 heparinase [Vibrio vulnificus]